VKNALAAAGHDGRTGDISRGDDAIEHGVRHGQLIQKAQHDFGGARRIGDQDHGSAALAEARERLDRLRKGRYAVVDDAPDIRQDNIVTRRERGKAVGERDHDKPGLKAEAGS
jgi:hypothetical protein